MNCILQEVRINCVYNLNDITSIFLIKKRQLLMNMAFEKFNINLNFKSVNSTY